jgi:CRISPR-associated protein Csx3
MVEFQYNIQGHWVLISFSFNEIIQPGILKAVNPPDAVKLNFASKGVILSGRGPIWLFGFLIHYYHPTKFVATYDPRLNGAVIVESHSIDYEAGDVIPVDPAILNSAG